MSKRLVEKTFSQLKKMYNKAEFVLADHASFYIERRNLVEHMLELEELTIAKQRIAELEAHNKLLRAVADEAHEYIKYEPISLIPDKYWRLRREAIDGGAMEDSE